MNIGAKMIVHGMVQGVGFRYFTLRHANALNLKGYVKNLSDGTVEVCVEGEKQQVDELRLLLEKGPGYSLVETLEFTYLDFTAKYHEFSVEY